MIINIDFIYPIGSIYMSVNSTNPGTLFGGTWTQLKDRFLLGAGSSYTAGNTGGESEHTLTVSEIPSHRHANYVDNGWGSNDWGFSFNYSYSAALNSGGSGYEGGGKSHNNMPPYLVVYMWKRTA